MSTRDLDARRNGTCWRCYAGAVLHAQETPGGIKGLWWCPRCERPAFGGASSARLTAEQATSLPRLPASKQQCQVCRRFAVLELHHLAPYAQFGAAADDWPTALICHDCHREWESKMGLGR